MNQRGLLGPCRGLRSTVCHCSLIQLTVFDLKTTDCVKIYLSQVITCPRCCLIWSLSQNNQSYDITNVSFSSFGDDRGTTLIMTIQHGDNRSKLGANPSGFPKVRPKETKLGSATRFDLEFVF